MYETVNNYLYDYYIYNNLYLQNFLSFLQNMMPLPLIKATFFFYRFEDFLSWNIKKCKVHMFIFAWYLHGV